MSGVLEIAGEDLLAPMAADAVARAVAYLRSVQLHSGELPVYASLDPTMADPGTFDPSVFPTAIAAHSLAACVEARDVHARALVFLKSEMDGHGLWRHWTRAHPHSAQLPPDMDDTSCASLALAEFSYSTRNREIILANRRQDGLFLTWILPRLATASRAHRRATWPLLRHLATLIIFFRRTSAKPGDVDAVVNANAVSHLGTFKGRDTVVAYLADVIRRGAETQSDKWYENSFAIWYFLSRALAADEDARAMLWRRCSATPPANALERALALCTALNCGLSPGPDDVQALLAQQTADGSWPRAALYHGGRKRLAGGGFAARHPDTPHWGSEALTTALCIEALTRAAARETFAGAEAGADVQR